MDKISWIKFFSMVDKLMIYRRCACSISPITQLIGRISDDHIEFHIEYLLRLVCMDKLIGMSFQEITSVINFLIGSTKNTIAHFPRNVERIKADISL